MDPAAYDAWFATEAGALCHRLERDALFSLAAFGKADRVLDAGCGSGVYLRELAGMGLRPVGVDSDEGMLRYAASSCGKGTLLVRAAVGGLPFRGAAFDKVVSVCTLEFLADPLSAVSEFARVLAGDGVLLAGFLNRTSPWAALRMEKGKDPSSAWHGVRFYTLADVAGLAFRAGLRMLGFRGAVYFPPEAKGVDVSALTVMEAEGRMSSPSSAAFIAAAFIKPRPSAS